VAAAVACADAFAYSSGLAAAVGFTLTFAVGAALGAPDPGPAASLVACAAFFIYGLDRLRDLARDRASSPERTRFVEGHHRGLVVATGAAGLAVAFQLLALPPAGFGLCLGIGAVGLLHRRLKSSPTGKVVYVTAAWTAACVGLPVLAAGGKAWARSIPESASGATDAVAVGLALGLLAPALAANLIASNLRAGKAGQAGWCPVIALDAARALSIAGAFAGLAAPGTAGTLAWIPAASAVSLVGFRSGERYGHLAVDGALWLGALAALLHARLA